MVNLYIGIAGITAIEHGERVVQIGRLFIQSMYSVHEVFFEVTLYRNNGRKVLKKFFLNQKLSKK